MSRRGRRMTGGMVVEKAPNVVFVFSDQHRADATGYAGNPDVRTPNLDRLRAAGVHFSTAVSNIPCCSPYRASLLTGQYPLTHGVFVNDVHLGNDAISIADAFKAAGYDTAYVGKWHVNGRGRSSFIPREDRRGFDFWRVLECTHDYNNSHYYADDERKRRWDGYDALEQTRCAKEYIRGRRDRNNPFFLVVSWGPPHNPYDTAPSRFRAMYDADRLSLRPNVPAELQDAAARDLAGYYAHISALDEFVGDLWNTIAEEGLEEDTIFVYTSDHGDMLGSQGEVRKQRPWDESILVPFLLRYPRQFGDAPRDVATPFGSPDIMPTLLGLCRIPVPGTVEGVDFAPFLRGEEPPVAEAALIECIHPFGEFTREKGGREYRGVRTERYTYVRDLAGPWLLYDNQEDPFQQRNLCREQGADALRERLDAILWDILRAQEDEFLPGEHYIRRWGYVTDDNGTVPYAK